VDDIRRAHDEGRALILDEEGSFRLLAPDAWNMDVAAANLNDAVANCHCLTLLIAHQARVEVRRQRPACCLQAAFQAWNLEADNTQARNLGADMDASLVGSNLEACLACCPFLFSHCSC
jgi:hypothetical protein